MNCLNAIVGTVKYEKTVAFNNKNLRLKTAMDISFVYVHLVFRNTMSEYFVVCQIKNLYLVEPSSSCFLMVSDQIERLTIHPYTQF
jgi:hypothetical protein